MTAHCEERTVKRLFYKLFTSKTKKFANALAFVESDGVILEIDVNNQWFAAMVHYKLEEARSVEGVSAPNLVLVRRKDLREVASMKLVIDIEKSEMLLGDFQSKIENKGYGSILLRNLIRLAKELGIGLVNGNLSSVDSDHFDKLRYLYEKFGFEVNISGDQGTIKKRIQL
jgi:GNAT superfamily N-acetyltransferase